MLNRALAILLFSGASVALAKLPPPTPQQVAEQAAKKAMADAEAAHGKQALEAAMDRIAARWRGRAAAQGWRRHAPTAIAVPAPMATVQGPPAAAPLPAQPVPYSPAPAARAAPAPGATPLPVTAPRPAPAASKQPQRPAASTAEGRR